MGRKGMANKDYNHDQVVEWFKNHGFGVIDSHMLGGGFPDLIVGRGGVMFLVEVKNPKRRIILTKLQKEFHAEWPVSIVSNHDDLERLDLVAPRGWT